MRYKKWGCIITCICLMFTVGCQPHDQPPVSSYAADNGAVMIEGDYTYEYDKATGGIRIVEHKYDAAEAVVYVPETINGKPVTVIGADAFYQHESVSGISLPKTLKRIENGAFYHCYSLRFIRIPASVDSIGENPFYRCASLWSIVVDEDNPYYTSQEGVLYNKDKTELISYPEGNERAEFAVPETVTAITTACFGYDPMFASLVIPSGVTTLPNWNLFAFPDKITLQVERGSAAEKYAKDKALTYEYVVEGQSYDQPPVSSDGNRIEGTYIYEYDKTTGDIRIVEHIYDILETEIHVPETINGKPVTVIGADAFYQHKKVVSISLPKTLKYIEGGAFYRCYSLQTIQIPASVDSIGGNPFFRCVSLEEIVVAEDNPHYVAQEGVLYNKDKTELISYPEGNERAEFAVPETVTAITTDCFGYDPKFTSLAIPSNVTVLPNWNLFVFPDKITLQVERGSAAEKYAKDQALKYEYVD